ncbi:MAG TPA: exodeoxyribonuclease V subunit gamma [Polyangia bacterium]|nr:exodeoxyribonuclease V subunit gamma [Polyangia bacterium]
MIRLCYSNRTEELLRALAADLAAARATRGIFEPSPLVVPNPQVETYVKLGVARENGVAAHLETRYLRHFLADVVAATAPDVALVDRAMIEGELLALFHDDARLAVGDLAAVRAYLAAGGDDPDAIDLRRAQLAAEISTLLDDYTFARPELVARWRQGGTLPDDAPGAPDPERRGLEAWQRALWLALFGRGGAFERRGRATARRYLDLPTFFATTEPRALRPPPATYVFGLSYVARLYRDVLAALGRAGDVFIYALNPCREYWEDLEQASRRSADKARFPRRRGGVQLSLLGDAGVEAASEPVAENPILSLWGRPGRENIALLNQLSDCDFVARFADPTEATSTPTVLAQLQQDVLDRAPARAGRTRLALADDSVTVLPCPSARRELETIAAEIWRLAGPGRRFTDFAVIVPPGSADAYLPLAAAVFREASDLPHTIVDAPVAASDRTLEAVSLLLDLPLSPLGRPDLLRLLMHPSVAGRFPDADPRAWLALAEELDIVRGADRGDHAGSYVEGDRFNWDQGLRRIALGSFLSGPRSGASDGFVLDGERYLPAELAPEAQVDAQGFVLLARGRLAFAARARAARQTIAEWTADLRREIATTVLAGPDEEATLGKVYTALERLATTAPPGLRVGYRIVRELVTAELGRLPARGARYLTQGVAVSTFLPMRAVPFEVVFLAGMGEGRFPARETTRELDLRAGARARRVPGDVSPREQDQYMFLEALLCARERLYVSYVDRHEVSGEPLGPASTALELLEILDEGYLRGGRAAVTRTPPPMRRHEDDAACAVIPAAARERRAARLGRTLEARADGRTLPEWPVLRKTLSPAALAALGPALSWTSPSASNTAAQAERSTRRLTMRHVLRFLQCPLQGSARALLPFYADELDDEAAAATREHEDFDLPWPAAVPLLREALAHAARPAAAEELATALDEATALARLDGTLPHGIFETASRARLLTCLGGWEETLAKLGGLDAAPAPVHVGQAPEHRDHPVILPALRLALDTIEVELSGDTSPLGVLGGEPALLMASSSTTRDNGNGRDRLQAFVEHVALAAIDPAGAPRRRGVVLRPGQDRPETFWLRAVAQDVARAYLTKLLAELLRGVHPYFFPCEGVLGWRKKKDPRPELTSYIQTLRDADWRTYFTSEWGPVPNATEYPLPPDEETARRFVDERFGLYFDTIEEDAPPDRGEPRKAAPPRLVSIPGGAR